MSVLTLAGIRARTVAACVDLAGATASRVAYDEIGRDARSLTHRSVAVGVPGPTTPAPLDRQQARGARLTGATALSAVFVRTLYRLRPDAQVEDYDRALAWEQEVLAAALRGAQLESAAETSHPRYLIRLVRVVSREVVPPDAAWLLCTYELEALHDFPLSLASEST